MYITQLCGDLICCLFSMAEQLIPEKMKDWTTFNCSVCSTICHYDFPLPCRHTFCFHCLKVSFYTTKTRRNNLFYINHYLYRRTSKTVTSSAPFVNCGSRETHRQTVLLCVHCLLWSSSSRITWTVVDTKLLIIFQI